MHAGTIAQENCLEKCKVHDYAEQCKFLEKNNLLYDNGYKYGSKWLFWEIPENDLKVIKEIMEV